MFLVLVMLYRGLKKKKTIFEIKEQSKRKKLGVHAIDN